MVRTFGGILLMSSAIAVVKYCAKRLKRIPMELAIRKLASWNSDGGFSEGYSVAIACMHELSAVAIANLKLCSRMNHARLGELILVFNCPVDQIPAAVTQAVLEAPASMRIRLVGYDPVQQRVARRINWGWVYSWLSWSLAIGQSTSKALIIHDLDAMPLDPDFFEQVYDGWKVSRPQFCGIRRYRGNGIDERMNLVTTFELTLDAEYLRRNWRPFDLFNKLRLVDGRVIDFDTMLYVQWKSPAREVRPIEESKLVHPAQLICQYTDLASGRANFQGRNHSLPMLAYFLYLGGDAGPMTSSQSGLDAEGSNSISMFGRTAFIDGVKPETWAWIEKQIRRVEKASFGVTRPEVESYLQGIIRRAGSQRTVGREGELLSVN